MGAMIEMSLRRSGANDETRIHRRRQWSTSFECRPARYGRMHWMTSNVCGDPRPYPEGLARAYAYWSEDGQEIIGVSFWDSKESCDAWRASEAEERRREAMAPYVLDAQEAFYRGRELGIPGRKR